MTRPMHLSICIESFGEGGAQRAMVRLSREIAAAGWPHDFVVFRKDGPYEAELPSGVEATVISSVTPFALVRLALHGWARPGTCYLTTQENVSRVVALAKRLRLLRGRLVWREANRINQRPARGSARIWKPFMPWLYRAADGYITLSKASRAEIARVTGWPENQIPVIPNALDVDALLSKTGSVPPHPWLNSDRKIPVVLGVGRLVPQKGFDTLIDAVARVRENRRVRLVLLGVGPQEQNLRAQAAALGMQTDFDLMGFQDNPYSFMARADLFVLSSRWEGSPNVLLEAMAVGAPVVACDCPSGPREILTDPTLGTLVPVDDPAALASSITKTLDNPGNRSHRQNHIRRNHEPRAWAAAYIQVLEEMRAK